jgi:hypothetical protein
MRRDLSLDSSPSLAVPLRFFLNVPLFAVLAAGLLLWAGPDAFASRWSPACLALTHLFTLGILASAMAGALIQILPVATGVRIAWERTSAAVVHALLTVGALTLSSAFIFGARALYLSALLLLGAAFLWLLAACAIGFWQCRGQTSKRSADVLRAVRLALAALLATATLGVMLAGAQVWPMPFQLVALTDLHAMWGLSGWVGLLTIGIAYQLIPMFQVTEPYPRLLTNGLAPVVFGLLVLISISAATFPRAERPLGVLLLLAYAVFAITTLYLLWTRKRPAADATTLFWRTAMSSLACCGPLWIVQVETGNPALSVTLGVLCLFGVAWSSVNGMLYKIIPFLLWYHSQKSLTATSRIVPKVKDMIPDRVASRQFWAHLAAFALLIAASVRPAAFARVGALAVGVSAAWLAANMFGAIRRYLRVKHMLSSIDASTS